jgi:hypothetical protein
LNLLRSIGPVAALQKLVLSSAAIANSLSADLNFQLISGEPEEQTCQRLLWKFGYTLPRYESDYSVLRDRISEFRTCVLQLPSRPSEQDRARVRASGVNLFVSIERFLEDLVAYNVWLMSSDHFGQTKFTYLRQDALESVSRKLGQSIVSGAQTLEWRNYGENTLGVLLAYLQRFLHWIKSAASYDKDSIMRNPADFPHYARHDDLRHFPFRHVELWADVRREMLANYHSILDRLWTQLSQSELASVRNALDHQRDEHLFPKADKMLACVTRLQDSIEIADQFRLVPKLYWCERWERHSGANVDYILTDYRGFKIAVSEPSLVSGRRPPSPNIPQIVAPIDLLNGGNSILNIPGSHAQPLQ